MKLLFTAVYVGICVLALFGYLKEDITIQYATRPLVCLTLLVYYYAKVAAKKSKQTNLSVYLSLLAALIGDVIFVENHSLEILSLGIICYLIMYLSYVRVYQIEGTRMLFKDLKTFLKALPAILFIFISFGLIILQNIQALYLPISMLYTVILAIYTVISFIRETNSNSYIYGIIGASAFILASVIPAYQLYFQPILYNDFFAIMLYCIGQYAIIAAIETNQDAKFRRRVNLSIE